MPIRAGTLGALFLLLGALPLDAQVPSWPQGAADGVNDGSTIAGVDLAYQFSPIGPGAGSLRANWIVVPGATTYLFSIGTAPGASDVFPPTDVGLVTSFTAGGLTLQGAWTGTTYFVSVRPRNGVIDGPLGTSNGVQVAEAAAWDGASTADLLANPVALFRFDEGAGVTTADASGNGNTGTLGAGAQSPVWTGAGRIGGALVFDGFDDRVIVPNSGSVSIDRAQLTVMAWVFPSGGGSGNAIIVNKESSYEFARSAATGTLQHAIETSSVGAWSWADTGVAVPVGVWSHVAFTYDGANVRTYLNGVLSNTQPPAGAQTGPILPTGSTLQVGGREGNPDSQNFQGTIDEVAVFDVVVGDPWIVASAQGAPVPGDVGGFSTNWPDPGLSAFFGAHYFESVTVVGGTTTRVQGWGKVGSVPPGIGAGDPRVLAPRDGQLSLFGNTISVDGTITSSGRGHGGGGGGASSSGVTANRGEGGSNGRGGAGGSEVPGGTIGAGGGGGAPGGAGGAGWSGGNGGAGNTLGGGGGGCVEGTVPAVGGDGGSPGAGPGAGAAGVAGNVGGAGQSVGAGGNFGGSGGTGEFSSGGGGGARTGAGAGGGAGGGGGGYGGGGGGGGVLNRAGGPGAGPFGGAGGAYGNPGSPGLNGGYQAATSNGDSTTGLQVFLGSGGGGGGGADQPGAGGGGAGGGLLALNANGSITLGATARLLANGAGGGGGACDDQSPTRFSGPGAHGAGGGILLNAPAIDQNATGANFSVRGGDGVAGNGGTIKLFARTRTGADPTAGMFGRFYRNLLAGAPPAVRDGAAGDIDFSNVGGSLPTNWDAATAGDRPIASYEVSLGHTPGATEAVGWTNVGLVTAFTFVTPLTDGFRYFVNVRAIDDTGFAGAVTSSDGVLIDLTPPSVPVLVTPADAALFAASTVALDWGDSTDATSGVANYDVQVASDAAFTLIEWAATVAPSDAITGVLPDGLHFWRVLARDNAGNVSAFSASRTFTTDTTPPSVPVLATPADGALLATSTVALDWGDSADATSGVMNYDVQVASDAAFTLIQWAATVVPSGAITGVLPDGVHFWRVLARDNAGNVSAFSPSRTFTTDTTPPSVPVLATPADGALLATSTVALDWGDSADATSGVANYDVQVAADAGFTVIQWGATVVPSDATTGALPDGLHFWRVLARDNAGNVSAFSAVRSFTTDTVGPSVPVLVSPADGVFLPTTTPALDWADSTDATVGVANYDVEVAADAGFTVIQWSATVVPSTAVTGVLPDGVHFWRVRARDNVGNVSSFSAARSFTTDTVPPSVPVLTSPADGAVVGLSAVPLDWLDSADATSGVASYDVEVALDAAFTAIAWSATVVPSTATTAALADELYFWRARASDRAGNVSAFSASRRFTVLASPARWQPSAVGSDAGGGISNTAAPSLDPCMAVNPVSGQAGVVWTDSDALAGDREIFLRERVGITFAELAGSASGGGLSNNATGSRTPSVAYDALGRAVVAWGDDAGGDSEIYVRRFDGAAWAELAGSATGGGVSANGTSSSDPRVAVNPATGQPGVAWVDFSLGDDKVLFREYDGAAWAERAGSGSGRGVSGGAGASLDPSLAYDAPGRAVVAWADRASGNFEVYVRRWNGVAWEELGGSGNGGGVSRTPLSSRHPSVAIDASGQPVVIWEEEGSGGNSEVLGRRWNGAVWVDAGATGGGISGTPGASTDPHLSAGPGGIVLLAVWTDASDPQGDLEVYGKLFVNGAWREAGAASARVGGISSNASSSSHACCGVGASYAYVSWQDDASGNWEVYVRRLLLANLSDGPLEIVAGPGRGGNGQYRVFDDGTTLYAPLELRTVPFPAYDAAVGALHPACGDVDGEGLDEVVLGLGTYTPLGGWVVVMRDHSGRFEVLRWVRMPWAAYNAANGAVFPACGDVDGDGRDELVLGTGAYPQNGSFLAVLDDAAANFALLGWIRAGFAPYNSTVGETHPACGDVDGDGLDEIVIGLSQGGAGVAQVRDDRRRGWATIGTLAWPDSTYTHWLGETWPACVDLNRNGSADIVLCPGAGGTGRLHLFADRAGGFARTGALGVPWGAYNTTVGASRPAGGNLDADADAEVVVGLGSYPGAQGGFLYVFNGVSAAGSAGGRWIRYVNGTYNATNGETFPAVGQVR